MPDPLLRVRIEAETAALRRGLATSTDSVKTFARSLQDVGQRTSAIGGTITRNIGLPVAGALVGAARVIRGYQESMNTFQAVTQAGGAEMNKVGALARKLGADLTLPGTSAKDAAAAMTELAKAGLSVEQSMAAARAVLQLSAAAQIDNASAATITANALNAFSLKGDQAIRIADLLAAAANASSAEITDVADAFAQSSAVFASAGIVIEDLATSVALMANKGIKGSDAGTSLKTMVIALQAPTKASAKLMKDLGIEVFDAQGKMKPFRNIVVQFERALGGATQEQRAFALSTIFGTDALRAANVVMLGGVRNFDALKTNVTKAGAAADVAKAKTKGMGGALDSVLSSLETVAIAFDTTLGPPIEKVAKTIAKMLGKLEGLSDGQKQLVAFGAIGAVALGPLLKIVGNVTSAIGGMTKLLGGLGRGIGVLPKIPGGPTGVGGVGGIGGCCPCCAGGGVGAGGKGRGILGRTGDKVKDWGGVIGTGVTAAIVKAGPTIGGAISKGVQGAGAISPAGAAALIYEFTHRNDRKVTPVSSFQVLPNNLKSLGATKDQAGSILAIVKQLRGPMQDVAQSAAYWATKIGSVPGAASKYRSELAKLPKDLQVRIDALLNWKSKAEIEAWLARLRAGVNVPITPQARSRQRAQTTARKGGKQEFHGGGVIMHGGGGVSPLFPRQLRSDERPIIGQTGEGVLSRRGMRALGELNAGGMGAGGGGVTIHVAQLVVREEADIERIARALHQRTRRLAGKGL